ncbi:unnamed protein product [Ixodes persulcatus]
MALVDIHLVTQSRMGFLRYSFRSRDSTVCDLIFFTTFWAFCTMSLAAVDLRASCTASCSARGSSSEKAKAPSNSLRWEAPSEASLYAYTSSSSDSDWSDLAAIEPTDSSAKRAA